MLIIMIMRWSGDSPVERQHTESPDKQREIFDTQITASARKWLNLYIQATGTERAEVHAVVHAGTNVRTRYVPVLNRSDDEKLEKKDFTGQIHQQCPLCPHVSILEASQKATLDKSCWVWAHIGKHMFELLEGAQNGSAHCQWKNCAYVVKGVENSANLKRIHYGNMHGKVWLERHGTVVLMNCYCTDPGCQRQYINHDDLCRHLSGIECPMCAKSFLSHSGMQTHYRKYDWHEQVIPGWFRCDIDIYKFDNTWGEYKIVQKDRLLTLSGLQCPWCSVSDKYFKTQAALKRHCDSIHSGEPWPYAVTLEHQCGLIFPSLGALKTHERNSHSVLREQRENPWNINRQYRGMELSQQVTADLRQACQKQQVPRPVLLSVGLDGFTCNTTLLSKWLEDINLDFTFVVVTKSIPNLNPQHFIFLDDSYIGVYESTVLQRSLLDRSKAPVVYAELLDHWDAMQGTKDQQAKFIRPRNFWQDMDL